MTENTTENNDPRIQVTVRLQPELHERLSDFIHEAKKIARASGQPLIFAGDAMATAVEFWLDCGAPSPEADPDAREELMVFIRDLQVKKNSPARRRKVRKSA